MGLFDELGIPTTQATPDDKAAHRRFSGTCGDCGERRRGSLDMFGVCMICRDELADKLRARRLRRGQRYYGEAKEQQEG